jgi:hypothetical protein
MNIVLLIIGIITFFQAGGVTALIKGIKRSIKFLKRFGKKGIKKLKGFNRKQIKEVFDEIDETTPKRIPFKIKKMNSRYINEETGKNSWCAPKKVKYLNKLERLEFKIEVINGKLYDFKGNVLDTKDAGTLFNGKGKAMFVMDENGFIYVSKIQSRRKFHHSSFLAGQSVSGAGEVKVINGVIKEISRKSGHYTPSKTINLQVVEVLKQQGVNVNKILITDGF